MWRALVFIFIVTALAVILLASGFSMVTSIYQTKPLKEMAAATRNFAHGEFDTRVNTYGRQDEIGELAEAFNAMAESLAKSEARRSEFVANVSHELKTPMTTIAGFADGILDGTIPPERHEEALRTISDETRRLSRLVRRMLELSRLQSTDTVTTQAPFDIGETMARVLISLETKITAKGLDVEADLPQEPLMAWGNSDAITQVGYNLLDNAIKFAREGGKLRVGAVTRGNKVYVSVSDEGETIPPEELPLIFDRFHKTDHSRSVDRDGVGLGLYIVKTILNDHKEDITVTSENGVTEFTFTLTKA
jgi:signal transduction histidine kinase